VTNTSGTVMFSPEKKIHLIKLPETQQKKNVVFPTTETPRTELQDSFTSDLRPILHLQKILGHFPLHMNYSGNIDSGNNKAAICAYYEVK
jgi:hypothetical protein